MEKRKVVSTLLRLKKFYISELLECPGIVLFCAALFYLVNAMVLRLQVRHHALPAPEVCRWMIQRIR